MCWNAQVSIFSFFIILGVSYGLYTRNLYNDRLLAFFIISYGSMQLCETFMWTGQSKKWQILNIIGSIFACLLLYFHPLALMIGVKLDRLYQSIIETASYKILFGLSGLFLLFGVYQIIYQLFYISNKTQKYTFLAYPDKKTGHLIWSIPTKYNYTVLLSIIIAILIIAPLNNLFFTIFLCIYYLAPFYFILIEDGNDIQTIFKLISGEFKNNDKYYGSYWCWIVAFFSFIMYLVNPYLQPIESDKL